MNEFYLTDDASPTSSDVFFKIKLIFFISYQINETNKCTGQLCTMTFLKIKNCLIITL